MRPDGAAGQILYALLLAALVTVIVTGVATS